MIKVISKHFTTNDNVKLHYLEAGTGKTVIMLPGAGFSANLFKNQIEEFKEKFRVISLDKRGHGKSEKVDFGYRVSRFGKDLHDFLEFLELDSVIIIAHSLGASSVYEYIDLFGTEKISKLVIIDEPASLLINPIWTDEEIQNYGAVYEASTLHELTNKFFAKDSQNLLNEIVDRMTTKFATEEQKNFILKCMEIPGQSAAKLYFNNICQDFRDVFHKIDVPTLLITGRVSIHPWKSHKWMSEHILQSALEIISEEDGGNHFPFVEKPDKFNKIIISFLKN
jgi:pimeloyl-ACP methyl ester carboxylesterase